MTQPFAMLSNLRPALCVLAVLSGLGVAANTPAVAASDVPAPGSFSYVLFEPGTGSTSMSGSTQDLTRARSLRSGLEGLLYARSGGAAYFIRDPQTLSQARLIVKPQAELGAQQAELGARQAALGQQQAALGERQAVLGGAQARLGLRQANASSAALAELGRQQGLLAQQQAELGRQQDALGRQQQALGEQQAALGREQARLGRLAEAKFRELLRRAIERGVALPAN